MAAELDERIAAFVERVEKRRRLLELTVTFYTHFQEVRRGLRRRWFVIVTTLLLHGRVVRLWFSELQRHRISCDFILRFFFYKIC